MMEVIWKKPSELPEVKRGDDIKVWGLVDIYRYQQTWGGLGSDGRAERILTLEKVDRRVVEMRYALANATDEELESFNDTGDWPEESPGWLDDWVNEDGEFQGVSGFYREHYDEGRVYHDALESEFEGKAMVKHACDRDEPGTVLLAWAKFERPAVPETIPE